MNHACVAGPSDGEAWAWAKIKNITKNNFREKTKKNKKKEKRANDTTNHPYNHTKTKSTNHTDFTFASLRFADILRSIIPA